MSSRLRTWGKRIGYGVVGVVAIVVLFVAYLHTSSGGEMLRGRIETRLRGRVTTSVTLGKVSFSLFSGTTLEDLVILDLDGKKGIAIRRIFVKPNLGEIASGTIALDQAAIEGVNVEVRGRPDGTTSLTGVVIRPEKNPKLHVVVRDLALRDVGLHLTKPDGLDVTLERLAITGNVDTQPYVGTTHGALSLEIAKLAVTRPELTLAIAPLTTKLAVSLDDGKGRVDLGPTQAQARLERKDQAPIERPLSLGRIGLETSPERLGVALDALTAAAASIATAKVEATRKPDGSVDHVSSAEITTLLVRASEVEAFAGKRLLAGDLTIDVKATGAAQSLAPEVTIKTPGGDVTVSATLDLRDPGSTGVDAKLTTRGLDVAKIYVSEKLPPITVGALTLDAKVTRRGDEKSTAFRANGVLHAENVHVRDVVIDTIDAKAGFDAGAVTIESLDVRALGQKVSARARYLLETKSVDADVVLDAKVGQLVTELRKANVLTTPPSPLLGALSLGRPVHVHVAGRVDGELTVRITELDARAASGGIRGDVTATLVRGDTSKGEKAVTLRAVKADLDVRGVSLAEVGRLRGRKLPVSGRASGRVRIEGDPRAPDADVDLVVSIDDAAEPAKSAGTLRVNARGVHGRIEGHATLATAGGEVLAKIDGVGRTDGGPIDVALLAPERSASDLAPFLPPDSAAKIPAGARVGLSARLRGDGRRTQLEAEGAVRLAEGAAPAKVRVKADLEGNTTTLATAKAHWSLDADVPETELAALPLPPERRAAIATLHGRAKASIHLEGTRDDAGGDVVVELHDVGKGEGPHADAKVAIALAESTTSLTVDATAAGATVVKGTIRAALGGRGILREAARGKLRDANPSLDGKLEIPERTMEEWSKLLPAARDLPGRFGGELVVSGAARSPSLDLDARYAGYSTLDGKEGHVRATAKVKPEAAKVVVTASDVVTLTAEASPAEILAARALGKGDAHVKIALGAAPTPLVGLVPASERTKALAIQGTLASDLTADAVIAIRGEERALGSLAVRGQLAVRDASLGIPTTRRRVHDVSLVVDGDGDALSITSLSAKESDRDEPNRTLSARGRFAIRERDLALHVETNRVLVSGGSFGELDAPKAALTAKVDVKAALGGPFRAIVVDVDTLDLVSPDRQPRAVQQEVLSLGDVVELSSGVAIGRLPITPAESIAASTSEPPPPEEKTLDVVVHVPKAVHVKQRPLDLYVQGDVHIERYGERRVLSGTLDAVDGSLLVGGREHRLTRGAVKMTDAGPFLDLHFRREPHPAALRDITTSGETSVHAHMVGVFGKQKISFSGAADGLFEGLAFENLGRVRVLSTPEAPLTQTPQLPQTPQIRQTAFMSANLPHLAFLDRTSTYADPNPSRFSYGRFESLEAERYSKDGTRRLRTTVRPRVIGQSDSEVEGSLLFTNTPRVVAGVGVVGGTRVGGGPVLFWEWSSED
ncbi:MAG: hypothetical protein JST00_01220 [Deltaproteobacteria bacterium]|nr:hypothetical protein [Deltaproteobacteria bacterium]